MDPKGNLHPLDVEGLFTKDDPSMGVLKGENPPEDWPVFTIGEVIGIDGREFEIAAAQGRDLTLRLVTPESKQLGELAGKLNELEGRPDFAGFVAALRGQADAYDATQEDGQRSTGGLKLRKLADDVERTGKTLGYILR